LNAFKLKGLLARFKGSSSLIVRSKRLKMVLICVRLIRAYISYCIVQRVGMWRLYCYVIYSNSLWAALFFSSRNADQRAVVKSKHLVQLLSYHSGISASYSPASHYKCKSVTFLGFSLHHFRFVYVCSVCVYFSFNHNEPQLLIASE